MRTRWREIHGKCIQRTCHSGSLKSYPSRTPAFAANCCSYCFTLCWSCSRMPGWWERWKPTRIWYKITEMFNFRGKQHWCTMKRAKADHNYRFGRGKSECVWIMKTVQHLFALVRREASRVQGNKQKEKKTTDTPGILHRPNYNSNNENVVQ